MWGTVKVDKLADTMGVLMASYKADLMVAKKEENLADATVGWTEFL